MRKPVLLFGVQQWGLSYLPWYLVIVVISCVGWLFNTVHRALW